MTNSTSSRGAEAIVDEIVGLLDEGRMRREIDERIDSAMRGFRFRPADSFSAAFLHQVIAEFVARLYEHGLRLPRRLSRSQAGAEALFLIDQQYQGTFAGGYDGALADAVRSEQNGIDVVLVRVAQAVRERERQDYVRWVFADRLGCCDWRTQCEIVRLLLDRYRRFLPEELRACEPAQLVDEIPAIISHHLATNSQLRGMLGSYPVFWGS